MYGYNRHAFEGALHAGMISVTQLIASAHGWAAAFVTRRLITFMVRRKVPVCDIAP